MNPHPSTEAFSFHGITKTFGSVSANTQVSFSVEEGTVHGVVGENGAGKSTIMKILYGMFLPDSGVVHFKGVPTVIDDPQTAIQLGIGMVHQHFMLVPTLTVWENIVLGREPSLWSLNQIAILNRLEQLKTDFGFQVDLKAQVASLPVGHQQQVEILKLLYREANILILDEPTAVLSPQEVESLFEKLKNLKKANKTIIIITHKLKEILAFTDRVTIMRQGRAIETINTSDLNEDLLAEKIIGRKRIPLEQLHTQKKPIPVLTVDSLSFENPSGCSLKDLTFAVHPGEIVGVAGIEGNGQKELVEVLAQVQRNYRGQVKLNQKEVSSFSPYALKQNGFSLIPPDRHHDAVVLSFSLAENAILGHHKENYLMSGPLLSEAKVKHRAEALIDAFDVRPQNPELPLGNLSGGNQQKLVVARETLPVDGAHPVSFLLAAHPTRGIDIGAIDFIHQHFLKLKSQGTGILLISSELEEILTLSDRILVFYQGQIVAETSSHEATERQLGLWMTRGAS